MRVNGKRIIVHASVGEEGRSPRGGKGREVEKNEQ